MLKNEIRIDKWLWAVRIFKTRAKARESCLGGKVKINGVSIKASYKIKPGELIQVRIGMVKFIYFVIKVAEKRMGAKHTINFVKDLTPDNEIDKLSNKQQLHPRAKGQGRPTKKERRNMDQFRDKF